jgi:spore coat polysaccharide biosynthesis protein SpsF (cytidylyltransferase family)
VTDTRILCLVPARGGSKGIPRKNLREVAGKPLIVWTLEQALATPGLDVVVSTDDSRDRRGGARSRRRGAVPAAGGAGQGHHRDRAGRPARRRR